MEPETLLIDEHDSRRTKQGSLILSVTAIYDKRPRTVDLLVGRIGFPNLARTLRMGDAVLFETSNEGLFEIRVMRLYIDDREYNRNQSHAIFGVSQLPPAHGPTAGIANDSAGNDPFTPAEVARIRSSLQAVQDAVRQREDLRPEQVDYISRRLDEIAEAAARVGRKDWINLAVGTLTNVVVGAAVGSEAAKFLFQRMGQALGWLLGEALKLLP